MGIQNIPKLRKELALAIACGNINGTLRKLKDLPISQLESLSDAEMKRAVDKAGLDEKGLRDLSVGLEKLDFYVCGILMHRILEGE